jgi:hypothetical protein
VLLGAFTIAFAATLVGRSLRHAGDRTRTPRHA